MKARELIGTTADVIAIGTFLAALLASGVAFAVVVEPVPAWVLAVAVIVLLIAVLVAYRVGRRSLRKLSAGAAERARADLKIATSYLSLVDDFLNQIQEAFSGKPPEPLERIQALRRLVLDAIVQGVNPERGERVRVAFLTLQDHAGEQRLRIKHHQGHTAVGEHHVALYPDARSIAGAAFVGGEPEYVADASADPRFQQTTGGRKIGTLYCLPVFGYPPAATPVGVLSVSSSMANAFDTLADQEFVSICANILAFLETIETALRVLKDLATQASQPTAEVIQPTSAPSSEGEGNVSAGPNVIVKGEAAREGRVE